MIINKSEPASKVTFPLHKESPDAEAVIVVGDILTVVVFDVPVQPFISITDKL